MPRPAPLLVALTAFVAYACLCPPVSGMGDASEFTLVLATGGVAHPTGYPLYTLFGHLFCLLLHALGIGWSLAANLWSAVGGAVAIYFLHALASRLAGAVPGAGGASPADATSRSLAALVPVSLFAFQPIVLGEATRAEVNSWSLAWTCGAVLAFVRVMRAISDGGADEPRRARRGAALWGLACGIGLSHHLLSILVSAPLTVALMVALLHRRRLDPAAVVVAIAAALLPLTSYGYVAWHAWHPARVQWYLLEPDVGSVLRHVIGAQYRPFLGFFDPSPLDRELLSRAIYPFLVPALGLVVFGLAKARDAGERILWSALLAAALLSTAVVFQYGVPDPPPYFLSPIALGVAAAAPALAAIPGAGSRAGRAGLLTTGLAALFLIVPWMRAAGEERAAAIRYEKVIHSMWSAIPPDTAIVSWDDDRYYRLVEYQLLRGEKPALMVLAPDLLYEGSTNQAIRQRLGADPMQGWVEPQIRLDSPGAKGKRGRYHRRLVEHLNARVRVPVIIFDPSRPIVWQLRKPWEPPDEGPAPPPVSPAGRHHP
jgi:hypothetical protein